MKMTRLELSNQFHLIEQHRYAHSKNQDRPGGDYQACIGGWSVTKGLFENQLLNKTITEYDEWNRQAEQQNSP